MSDMTTIKAEDILATLQTLELIQYRKGQHVICADPKVLDCHLKAAGRSGLEVDVSKLIWTPYKEQGDNTALGLRYGFNSQMNYGQYSPVGTPVPFVVVDNELYSPQQIPFSPSYYPQAGATSMPHISASIPVSQDLMNVKGSHSMDSGSNAGFYTYHGMFGSGEPLSITSNPVDLSQRTVSQITSAGPYSQPIGTFTLYDPNIAQDSDIPDSQKKVDEENVDKLSDILKDYDSLSPLDAWKTNLLLRVKEAMKDKELEEEDLT